MDDSRHGGARSRGATSTLTVEEQFDLLLKEGPKVPTKTTGDVPRLPPWFDPHLYRKGQNYFATNMFSMFTAKLSGLLVLLAIPSVLRVLMHTGRSSNPKTAFKRYLSTLTHMLEWYNAGVDGDLSDPNSRAYKSLAAVRGRHCAASRSAGDISQFDMAVTQFGFCGFPIVVPHKLGLLQEDQDGLVHFWRVIGYIMGIEDRFNICRPEGVEETRQLCSLILDQVFVPALKKPPEGFAEMARAMLEGSWAVVPAIQHDAVFAYTYTELAGLPYKLEKLDVMSRIAYDAQMYVQQQWLPSAWFGWILRPILNFLLWFSIFVTQKFQFLANYTLKDNVAAVQQNVYLAS